MIAVIDTNVWISALVFSKPGSVPGRVLRRIVLEDTLALGREIWEGIHRILSAKYGWTAERSALELMTFEKSCILVRLRHNVHNRRDPKDDMFLECAALANADVLVTGDKDLLSLKSYGSTPIVTPLEYVAPPLEEEPCAY